MSDAARPGKLPVNFDRSGVSRYLQLATLFRHRIESGYWTVGEQLPTVDALAAEYGVSRATIRQALGTLAQDQLIASYRAKGTFVIGQPEERLWCEVETDWSGLLRAMEGATIEVLSSEPCGMPPDLLGAVGQAAPAYRHLRRRHWRKGKAFLLASIYLEQGVFERIPEKSLEAESALRMLTGLRTLEIADVRQTLTIGSADVETAELLEIPLNFPVAQVRRSVTDGAGTLIFVGYGIYRGDVVRLDMKLK